MHEAQRRISTTTSSTPYLATSQIRRGGGGATVHPLSVAYIRTRCSPEVTVHVPASGGAHPVLGKVLGLQFVQGRLNHYRVELAGGGLMLVPPGWFRGPVNLLPVADKEQGK